tara:strand:+ start:171 stop:1211 length:1041 start_codon:yes stop_codon:yes gene_type:complete
LDPQLLQKIDSKTGILICGHGSRRNSAVKEFAELSYLIKQNLDGIPLEFGYLEFARPIISEALDKLLDNSVENIIAIPAMLFAAGHTKNDIPALLNNYSSQKQIKIIYGRELGINNSMIGAAGARVNEVLDHNSSIKPSETLLVVVGRGSSDPDANSNISKITRLLVEGFGFGWGETVFSGVTFPLVEPGLRMAANLGFKKIIVFPYFLFSGVLIDRINYYTDKIASEFPSVEFLSASYLGSHQLVVETFLERIEEVLLGNNLMNCSLCKYRSSLLGFEEEVGLAQLSHHHHVEGINGNDEDSHSQQDSHTHLHPHTHHLYPHSEHPFGPVTLRSSQTVENKKNSV